MSFSNFGEIKSNLWSLLAMCQIYTNIVGFLSLGESVEIILYCIAYVVTIDFHQEEC